MKPNPYLEKVAAIQLSPGVIGKQIGSVARSAASFAGKVKSFGVKDYGAKTPLVKRLQQAH